MDDLVVTDGHLASLQSTFSTLVCELTGTANGVKGVGGLVDATVDGALGLVRDAWSSAGTVLAEDADCLSRHAAATATVMSDADMKLAGP